MSSRVSVSYIYLSSIIDTMLYVVAETLTKTEICLNFYNAEYGMGSKMSTEGDVYSYGIMLLEILIGKRPTDELFNDGVTLRKYVEEALPQIGEILDPDLSVEIREDHKSHTHLLEQGNVTEVQKCILQLLNIGLKCTEEAPKHRPNIQDVYSEVVAVKEHFLSGSAKGNMTNFGGGNNKS